MAETFQLKLVTPLKTLFDEVVQSVIVPTAMGEITVLPHHIPLVGIVAEGELTVKAEGKEFPLIVFGGVLQFADETLTILADTAEHAENIDLDASERATAQLIQKLEDKASMDIGTYELLMKELEKERIKMSIGKKWRK